MLSAPFLIDTHILIWILSKLKRLASLSYLKGVSYCLLSPVSILELKFLEECGRLSLDLKKIMKLLKQDEFFQMDDLSFEDLCLQALDVSWTRDPFDWLLVAHSLLKGIPFATCDRVILENYKNCIKN
ncbi:MAG: hypothetical protein JNK65_02970 [Deltaproteobacteria bacterium]|nr:hypothetical protein [Deltaproteobacteria bacterium]